MQAGFNRSSLRFAAIAASCAALFAGTAPAQATPQAAPAASVQLTSYTAPDGSASAGVPAGWKVTNASQTLILMGSPDGAVITLGKTFIAHNAAFQPGQKGPNGTDLSMPYSANLEQKLITIFQQNAAIAGKSGQQFTFNSATPIQVPPILGQCGRFVVTASGSAGSNKLMGLFCSLPLDSGGNYKNIILLAQAPASVAQQDAPIAQAVFASYRIPQAMLARKLAPFTAPVTIPAGVIAPPGMSAATWALQQSDVSATCFDEGVIRGYSNRQLPQECGGEAPNP
jgi:hypothetical protein